MATITTCPSCGQKLPAPGPGGSAVSCPNPACKAPLTATARAATAPAALAAGRPLVRANGARPELLDRLPTSIWVSPPMFLIGGVVALLYGLVLFGVVSSARKARLEELARKPEHEAVAYPPVVSSADRNPGNAESAPVAPDAAKKGETPRTEPIHTEVALAKPAPAPAPAVAAAPAPTPVRPPVPPPPPPEPRVENWGPLTVFGSTGDCHIRTDGPKLLMDIPGSLHVLSPQLQHMNAPRMLTPARGDFTATVTVGGKILPGTVPLADIPFTFQGAGLLAWQDEKNYLRLERASAYDTIERKRLHMVLLEYCRDGRTINVSREATDAKLTLKFERHGSELRCSYNPDGKNWIEVKRQNIGFPNEVRVGISASNASPKPYTARLEDFHLTAGTAAAGKGS